MTENPIPRNMTVQEIQEVLRKKDDITFAGIQRDLNLKSYSSVYRAAEGKLMSDRIRRHIAKCMRMKPEDVWPEIYLTKKNPTRRGRPLSRGLYTGEGAAA